MGFLSGDPPLPGIDAPDRELAARLERALSERGPDYVPRTRHLREGRPSYTNRLVEEVSPYLLQHAHNPVNWFPWGPEAMERAERDARPIFLSVGYSTCHWCHVMEHESFEDEAIAAFLNAHFVPVKVDREERPDVDAIYMRAVQLLTGRGGWPMTVLLLPDGRPFFAGTYFPPRAGARGSRVGLIEILDAHVRALDGQREALLARAAELSRAVALSVAPAVPGEVPGLASVTRAVRESEATYDPTWGGFGAAPKFPMASRLGLLARFARRTGEASVAEMLGTTLRRMAEGGIYDQLGGGFHRYSTDARWLVPHFEKMLYDNAQLARIYIEGWQLLGDPDLARWAREILDYVAREMTSPRGAFHSATDADSPTPSGASEEGWYFTWTPEELEATLGPDDAAALTAFFGVTPRGNFEGRSVLHVSRPLSDVAARLGLGREELCARLERARPRLLEARAERPPPGLDDKILTEWNGMMIEAFARGALALGEPRYLEAARTAASFVLEHLRDGAGRLLRTYRAGRAQHRAYLEDHAAMIAGLLALYEVSGEARWLDAATELQAALDAHHLDPEGGGYFTTADDAEALLAREQPDQDGALPSGNSVTAHNLLHLAALTGDDAYRVRALGVFSAFALQIDRYPSALTHMLSALERLYDTPLEVVVVLPDGVPGDALLAALRRAYLPHAVRLVLPASEVEAHARRVPWLEGKVPLGGAPTAYVCELGRCALPTTDPRVFAEQLAAVRPSGASTPPGPEGRP